MSDLEATGESNSQNKGIKPFQMNDHSFIH